MILNPIFQIDQCLINMKENSRYLFFFSANQINLCKVYQNKDKEISLKDFYYLFLYCRN